MCFLGDGFEGFLRLCGSILGECGSGRLQEATNHNHEQGQDTMLNGLDQAPMSAAK